MRQSKIIERDELDFITLHMAKRQLNILDRTDEDAHIAQLVKSAMELAEKGTKRLLSRATVLLRQSDYSVINLPYGEADEIVSVQIDGEDVDYTFDELFQTVEITNPSKTVDITFKAGFAQGEVPQGIKMDTLILISWLYENRGEGEQGEFPYKVFKSHKLETL